MPITPIAAKFPAAIVAQADLGGPLVSIPANELVLNTSLAAGDLAVVSTTAIPTTWPASGWLTIDSEIMHYSSYTASTFTIDIRGDQTAYGASAATTHTAGATIGLYYGAKALDQLNSEVIALETFFSPGGAVATIASNATTDLSTIAKLYIQVTGTTTITSFGTVPQGVLKVLEFAGALTLTHNATSLILSGGVNYTTAAGDVFVFVSEGSGNWREVARSQSAFRATGDLVFTPAASQIVAGATSLSLRNNANNSDNLKLVDAGMATFRQGIQLDGKTTSRQRQDSYTLANTALGPLWTLNNAFLGFVTLISRTDGECATFLTNSGGAPVLIAQTSGNLFSTTAGTASKTNVYWSAGNSRYEVQNNRGVSQNYDILVYSST